MANFKKNDEGVSAVIGVILMVAITVILAAVIAAFVFGMGSGVKKTYIASFTVSRPDMDTIIVTNTGGQDADKLQHLVVTIDGVATVDTENGVSGTLSTQVGSSEQFDEGTDFTGTGRHHVVVSGLFADGTRQILLESDV